MSDVICLHCKEIWDSVEGMLCPVCDEPMVLVSLDSAVKVINLRKELEATEKRAHEAEAQAGTMRIRLVRLTRVAQDCSYGCLGRKM